MSYQKCASCGKELKGEVYRIDKGSFGSRELDHFLEEFKFEKRVGYFCPDCLWIKDIPKEGK